MTSPHEPVDAEPANSEPSALPAGAETNFIHATNRSDLRSRRRRLWLLAGCLICGWLLVSARLIGLYIADADQMRTRVAQQQTTIQPVPARPGDILDRHGRLLATSIETRSLYAVPRAIADIPLFSRQLATVLKIPEQTLQQQLDTHREKGFLWLSRRLEPDVVQRIRALGLTRDTFGFESEFRRHYPQGRLGIHVLGLRDIDGVGHGGIEQAWDATLRGADGERVLVRNALNRVVHLYDKPDRPVRQGQTVRLAIDLELQRLVQRELEVVQQEWQPRGCCAILCDPRTIEVLALASAPDYHPEDPTTFSDDGWMNRAIAWSYEPGSTIKPLIVAWALQQRKVSLSTEFEGHGGAYRMGRRLLHDTHPHGQMSLADVLILSSNIGMAQIGERLTNPGLAEGLQRFGFGYRTGLGLAGELPGSVRPLAEWNSYSTGSIPMGQEFMVTPLQMIVAHAVLANGGHYRQPRLVLEPTQPGLRQESMVEMPVIDRGICQWVVTEPMVRVLTEGTGRKVQVEGLSLFGKTGTSQVYDPELGRYSNTRTVCSFICGLPADQPELIAIVVVDEPTVGHSHFGSNVAAPATVRILKAAQTALQRPLARGLVSPIR